MVSTHSPEKQMQVVDLSGLPSPSTEKLGLHNSGHYAEQHGCITYPDKSMTYAGYNTTG